MRQLILIVISSNSASEKVLMMIQRTHFHIYLIISPYNQFNQHYFSSLFCWCSYLCFFNCWLPCISNLKPWIWYNMTFSKSPWYKPSTTFQVDTKIPNFRPALYSKVSKIVIKFFFSTDDSTGLVQIKDLSVSPSPIVSPGNLTVSGQVILKTVVTGDLQVSLVVRKKMFFFWLKAPCIASYGSW